MKIALTILSSLLTSLSLLSHSAVLSKDGETIFDTRGNLRMPDSTAIAKLKELGISPKDAANLTRFITTAQARLQEIQRLNLTTPPKEEKRLDLRSNTIEILSPPLSERPFLLEERTIKNLAQTSRAGHQLAADIRSKNGLVFNMETVRPDEIKAVTTFFQRHKATTFLEIKNLKEDILIKALESLAAEGFTFTALKNLQISYHERDRRPSANLRRLIHLFGRTMPHLRILDIAGNNIGDEGAQAIRTMHNLRELLMGYNNIGIAGAQAISTMPNLEVLDIEGNNIGLAGAQAISTMHNLEVLNITSNNIGVAGAQAISTMHNLEVLSIQNNNIGVAGAQAISTMHNLEVLNIAHNNIGVAGAQAISTIPNLEALAISNNSIGVAGAQAISTMHKLTYLSIAHNNIGVAGAQAISTMHGLRELFIQNNNIGDEGAQAIRTMHNLERLEM